MKKPVALIILDGFALIEKVDGNAVKYAKKPNFDSLYSKYPVSSLGAIGFSLARHIYLTVKKWKRKFFRNIRS